jgi:hypothetical protein
MDNRPNPDKLPPVVWKLICIKTLQYPNCKIHVSKWSSASNYKIGFDTMTNPFTHCYSVIIVQRHTFSCPEMTRHTFPLQNITIRNHMLNLLLDVRERTVLNSTEDARGCYAEPMDI